jgi:putative tryptophan/tyrosine transport system substrate-binding protein
MTRCTLALLLTLALPILLAPCSSATQEPANVPRVGLLMPVSPEAAAANLEVFEQPLREFGYLEGQNIVIARQYSEGRTERIPELANKLVHLQMDVIVTWGTPAT